MKKLIQDFNRSIKRNKGFLFINVTGLAIGLAVSLMLLLFVTTELSFDRHFKNKERIVRLNSIWIENGERSVQPICLRKAYTELPSEIPGIEKAVQIYRGWGVEIIREKERFPEVQLLYSDPEFFDVFQMNFIHGSRAAFLNGPNSAVITDKLAETVYGSLDVVGKTFTLDGLVYNITGVVKKLPANTHFSFDVLASMKSLPDLEDYGGLEFFTYYLLQKEVSKTEVCKLINEQYASFLTESFSEFNSKFESAVENLTDIYLLSKTEYGLGAVGNVKSVIILAGLALLILILAITNFVNLFIVQGDQRSFEVGIRKTNGGSIRDIAFQFFGEVTIIVLFSFVISALLASSLIKPFSLLISKTIEPSLILSPFFIMGILAVIAITIVLSASYPAFYLSHFKPIEVVRKARKHSKRRLTISIAIFQSVITIVLISVILVINKQLRHLQSIPKGYNTDNVMIISGLNKKIATHYESLRMSLEKLNEIDKVSAGQHTIGGGCSGQGIGFYGAEGEGIKGINEYRVFPGLCEIMGFELIEGKFYSENHVLNKNSIVINESAVKMLGINGSALGIKLVMHDVPLEVIGVVKDFYYDSPSFAVQPIALTAYIDEPYMIYVRFSPWVQKSRATQTILPVIRQYDPDFILNPRWCDDIYSSKFEKEQSLSRIVTASTSLSLIIALLGMFAIHSYSTLRRTKEIGIRKVLGSSSVSITYLLSAEIIRVIFIAAFIAVPISYFISGKWLAGYTNRITPGILIMLIPIFVQLLFTLISTLFISIRVSTRNPVESLRYE